MLKKYTSLLLAAGLALTLAACSPTDEEQLPEDDTPSVSEPENNQTPDDETTTPAEDQPTTDLPAEGNQNDQTDSNEPAAGQPDSQPEGGSDADKPSNPAPSTPETPSEPSAPTTPETPPSSGESTETPDDAADFTIDDIWTDIQTALSDTLPSLSKLDDETMTVLYPLSTDDLVEYGCYGSLMSVQASEFFIAKVQSGQMDAVKEAILSRQSDLEEQWRQYLPAQYELVQNYQLVQNGDYIFFGIAENISAAVDVFNQYTK